MNRPNSANPDKTIVEKRVAHQGDKSRKAVKDLRSGAVGNSMKAEAFKHQSFEIDTLQQHIKSQYLSMAVCLVLGAVTFFVSFTELNQTIAIIWYSVLILMAGASVYFSYTFKSDGVSKIQFTSWQTTFQVLSAGLGLCWTAIFALFLFYAPTVATPAVVFASTLVMTALAFASNRFLKLGVMFAIYPLTLLVALWLVVGIDPKSIVFAVLLITLSFSFQKFAGILRDNHIEYLASRAERDQLIMELDASRAISDEARRRAEDANLAKSRFLATMSHELRTPLNAILGFSEIMSNEVMGPLNNDHYKEYVTDIHRSGSHLLKLINEILDLSRVEAGRYKLNEEATNLAHAAEESFQMVKLKAAEKNVNLMINIQPNLPQIWADARSIRQIILNLLSNALKFTPSGGNINMKVGWTAGGGQYVAIRDSGPGIPEEEIPIVLSSFGQGSIAIKSAEQGTGLGLPIVQALVHMHDGKFELKSKLREGTEVIATFPRGRVMEVMSPVSVEAARQKNARNNDQSFKAPRPKVAAPAMAQ